MPTHGVDKKIHQHVYYQDQESLSNNKTDATVLPQVLGRKKLYCPHSLSCFLSAPSPFSLPFISCHLSNSRPQFPSTLFTSLLFPLSLLNLLLPHRPIPLPPLTTLDKISRNINSSIKKGRQISPPSSKLHPKT